MKIRKIEESREKCAEAGWYAYDYFLEEPMEDSFIYALRPLGSFVYLSMLKEPFFKIEGDCFMIKGVRGKDYFRAAVHDSNRAFLETVTEYVEKCG